MVTPQKTLEAPFSAVKLDGEKGMLVGCSKNEHRRASKFEVNSPVERQRRGSQRRSPLRGGPGRYGAALPGRAHRQRDAGSSARGGSEFFAKFETSDLTSSLF